MGMSKAAVLDALARFKVLLDECNDAKFVAKESGKTLISASDINKLATVEKGAQKNPDLSGYATDEKVQSALSAIAGIFGGEYTPPEPVTPDPGEGGSEGGGTGDDEGSGTVIPDPDPDDPDHGDENITDEEIQNIFDNNTSNTNP